MCGRGACEEASLTATLSLSLQHVPRADAFPNASVLRCIHLQDGDGRRAGGGSDQTVGPSPRLIMEPAPLFVGALRMPGVSACSARDYSTVTREILSVLDTLEDILDPVEKRLGPPLSGVDCRVRVVLCA